MRWFKLSYLLTEWVQPAHGQVCLVCKDYTFLNARRQRCVDTYPTYTFAHIPSQWSDEGRECKDKQ